MPRKCALRREEALDLRQAVGIEQRGGLGAGPALHEGTQITQRKPPERGRHDDQPQHHQPQFEGAMGIVCGVRRRWHLVPVGS